MNLIILNFLTEDAISQGHCANTCMCACVCARVCVQCVCTRVCVQSVSVALGSCIHMFPTYVCMCCVCTWGCMSLLASV